MTISKDPSAPLFAVVGSTGMQGGSVIKALAQSPTVYRVRAITRDPSKESAKALAAKGCEIIASDIGTLEGARKAFVGANFVFAVAPLASYDVENFREKHFAEGKAQVDGAKAEGVKTFVWSGLTNLGELTKGTVKVDHFDAKAEVTDYARSIPGMTVLDVQPGSYASNHFSWFVPRKQDDGSYLLSFTLDPDTPFPVIDAPEDYGKYVVAAVENGVTQVFAAPGYTTPAQVAEAFAKASGKKVVYQRMPDEELFGIVNSHQNVALATNLVATFRAIREVGYYGGTDLAESNKILTTPTRSFAQTLAANKEVVDKIFE
ncbi:NAD(P)-binding protein [Atractiella rhizophila]|nr:NAD(P)-binding protein [Atractiella rhizophila]